jgi:hypothetical protein
MIGIDKSSRHTRIVGHFGEYLVCNWLSRSGFEVSVVDHTGMDVIAYHPPTKQRLGITVKSRTRKPGTETDSVNLFQKAKDDRQKLLDACEAFSCEPWIAVYAECDTRADLFLTSLENYDKRYGTRGENAIDGWRMTAKLLKEYESDPEVRHIRLDFKAGNWWNNRALSAAAR